MPVPPTAALSQARPAEVYPTVSAESGLQVELMAERKDCACHGTVVYQIDPAVEFAPRSISIRSNAWDRTLSGRRGTCTTCNAGISFARASIARFTTAQ